MSRGVLGCWTGAQPQGGKGPQAAGLLPPAAAGKRIAGPDEADNDQPANPEITGIAAERDHAEDDDGDDGRDNPAGNPGSSKPASSSFSKSSASFWISSPASCRASAIGSMPSPGLACTLKQVVYREARQLRGAGLWRHPSEILTPEVVPRQTSPALTRPGPLRR
jgi:hypothetical protein